jgi:putative endonuclease
MEGYGKYAVYILASRKYGALYIGVTGDLLGRVITHREELIAGFTSRYHIHNLVYAEFHYAPSSAIQREKQLKKWHRAWKIELIEKQNPQWADLFEEIVGTSEWTQGGVRVSLPPLTGSSPRKRGPPLLRKKSALRTMPGVARPDHPGLLLLSQLRFRLSRE